MIKKENIYIYVRRTVVKREHSEKKKKGSVLVTSFQLAHITTCNAGSYKSRYIHLYAFLDDVRVELPLSLLL